MTLQKMLAKYDFDHQHPLNRASHMVGIPLILLSVPTLLFGWRLAIGIFAVGWGFQFLGHAIEGKMPTFFSNPTYLLFGPVHFSRELLGRLRPSDLSGGK